MSEVIPLKLNPITADLQQLQDGDRIPAKFITPNFQRGSVGQLSGNSIIAFSNTAPASTAGTLLWTANITPEVIGNYIEIDFDTIVDTSTNNAIVTIAIFRGTTLVGFASTAASGYSGSCPSSLAIRLFDPVTSLNPVTYTARIGVTAGNWYFGRGQAETMGGTNPTWWVVKETS